MKMNKVVAIIPARYASTRLPGKPLIDICGKSMVQRVYERVISVKEIDGVYVATDDDRIYSAVEKFGGKAIMTGECTCGTDRVYQACKDMDANIVLNIQGDEPLIEPDMIKELIKCFDNVDVDMATLKKRITNVDELIDPNVVKVITDNQKNAIYFSRYAIPYNRGAKDEVYYKHIGIYGYSKDFLKKFVEFPKGRLERIESLEQLRAIENGYKIHVKETKYQSIGVDTQEDISKVVEYINKYEENCAI